MRVVRKNRIAAAPIAIVLAGTAILAGVPTEAARQVPPPWEHCAFADHPVAADLGAVLPPGDSPGAATTAVLLGEVDVGTDCSIYDPMLQVP